MSYIYIDDKFMLNWNYKSSHKKKCVILWPGLNEVVAQSFLLGSKLKIGNCECQYLLILSEIQRHGYLKADSYHIDALQKLALH